MQTVPMTERSGIRNGPEGNSERCANAMQNNDSPLELFLDTNDLFPSSMKTGKYEVV